MLVNGFERVPRSVGALRGPLPLLASVLLLISTVLTGCIETNSYRYRLTVDVQTPVGLRQASALIHVRQIVPPDFFRGLIGAGPVFYGEAAFVNLEGNDALVALMAIPAQSVTHLPFEAFDLGPLAYRAADQLPPGDSRVLPRNLWPYMLVFTDKLDPKSGVVLHPGQSREVATRYRVDKVTIEIVDKNGAMPPATITRHLPWLNEKGAAEAARRAAGLKNLGMSSKSAFIVGME